MKIATMMIFCLLAGIMSSGLATPDAAAHGDHSDLANHDKSTDPRWIPKPCGSVSRHCEAQTKAACLALNDYSPVGEVSESGHTHVTEGGRVLGTDHIHFWNQIGDHDWICEHVARLSWERDETIARQKIEAEIGMPIFEIGQCPPGEYRHEISESEFECRSEFDLSGPQSSLTRTPENVSLVAPVSGVASDLGIQSNAYAPVSAQQITPSAENGSATALGLAALPVALLAGWNILSPDEWSAPSFGFSGNLTDASSDAVGRMSVQRGSLSAYADAHLSRGATTAYVGGAEFRAARWLSFTYAAHAREGKSDADLVFGAVADRRVGRWLFIAGADTDVGARAQASLSLDR